MADNGILAAIPQGSKDFVGNIAQGMISNIWIVFVILGLVLIGGFIIFLFNIKREKKSWTHKLIIRRKSANGSVSSEQSVIPMKRNVDKDGKITPNFRLKRPFMGCSLIIDPQHYTAFNEVSIIVDENNRIWFNEGELWNPQKNSIDVSVRHAEIDLQNDELRKTVKLSNSMFKKSNMSEILKSAVKFLLILAGVIVIIMFLQEWSKAHQADAQREAVGLQRDEVMKSVMETMQSVTNAQQLQLVYLLKKLYPGENIQQELNALNNSNGGT